MTNKALSDKIAKADAALAMSFNRSIPPAAIAQGVSRRQWDLLVARVDEPAAFNSVKGVVLALADAMTKLGFVSGRHYGNVVETGFDQFRPPSPEFAEYAVHAIECRDFQRRGNHDMKFVESNGGPWHYACQACGYTSSKAMADLPKLSDAEFYLLDDYVDGLSAPRDIAERWNYTDLEELCRHLANILERFGFETASPTATSQSSLRYALTTITCSEFNRKGSHSFAIATGTLNYKCTTCDVHSPKILYDGNIANSINIRLKPSPSAVKDTPKLDTPNITFRDSDGQK